MTSSFVGTRSPPRAGIPYAGRLLRFRPRLRVERLAGGEPTLEGVPVRDLRLAALPAQVCEIPTDPRVEVHEAQTDVLDLDAVVEDLPQVGVDRHADGRALVRETRVGLRVAGRRVPHLAAPVRLEVAQEVLDLPLARDLRVDSPEDRLEGGHEGIRPGGCEHSHGLRHRPLI